MHLWRYPSLSIHGIEGAFDEPGTKTVIPGRVIGKFSIRLVPHMNLSVVEKQVKQHLEAVFSKRNSSNKMTVSMVLGLHPWTANIWDPQYLAAKRAIKTGGPYRYFDSPVCSRTKTPCLFYPRCIVCSSLKQQKQ
ncbi:beta-Ala-His dipeptidase-like [Alexandromys fortis]|uniref:beta-Ala-His dipeptidase-like n=1 Tax=Alexandromys fortis TaxID=100897 RepID=UPI00215353A9|nr:beta-Ala-His dipeptidase-like [Microtus fortis]